MRLPSIIRETRGAWRVGVGDTAKLEVEFAIELMMAFSFQRSLVPPGIPSRLTSSCGSESSGGINLVSDEVRRGTISAGMTGLLGWFVSRRISDDAAPLGGDKIGSTTECIRGIPSV